MKRNTRLTPIAVLAVAALALPPAASASELTLAPNSLTFGSQQVGTTSAPQTMTLKLACGLADPACTIMGDSFTPTITTTPGFSQTNTCVGSAATLNAIVNTTESCTISVSFGPTVPGVASGTLSTGTDAAEMRTGPTAPLSGTGLAPPTTPAPAQVKKKKCKKKKKRTSASAAKRKCKKKKRGA